MVPGKQYLIKQTTKTSPGVINTLRYRIDVNTLHRKDSPVLKLNEIGRCQITLTQPICFDAYRRNRGTGAFIVVDRITNSTVAAGMILDRETGDGVQGHWDDESQTAGACTRKWQRHARRALGPLRPEAGDRAAHRPHRLGQNDDRLCSGAEAVR